MKDSKRPVVGIFGTNGTLSQTLSAGRALELAGSNTGNLIYQYAAERNVANPKLYFSQIEHNDVEMIKSSVDVIHIPAANQLNPNFDLGGWADLMDHLDKPIFIAGLGLQCELSEDEVQLTPGTVRFIETLKRLAPQIGVRGEATKKLLEKFGATNVVVIGCPSNFINRKLTGDSIRATFTRLKGVTNPKVDFFPSTMSNHRDFEAKLRRMIYEFDYRFVLQTNPILFQYVETNGISSEAISYLEWEREVIAPSMTQDEYNSIYKDRSTYYFSAAAWIDSLSSRDLGIGMRMHGVVATIQGGRAGVCVVSDGRIQELVDAMAYPHVDLDAVSSANSLAQVLESVRFDAALYDQRRERNLERYRNIANECDVLIT